MIKRSRAIVNIRMNELQERMYDKRESFRVQLRRESKNTMLRQKRARIIEAGEPYQQNNTVLEAFKHHSQEKEQQLCEQLSICSTAEELVELLKELESNRFTDNQTLELLLKLASRLLKNPSQKQP